MKIKLENISVKNEIWTEIKNKRDKFQTVLMNSIPELIEKVRYQGSVATKTIINPKISKGKNDIDLDVLVYLKNKPSSKDESGLIVGEIRKVLREAFGETINKGNKALTVTFDKFGEDDVVISIDIVLYYDCDKTVFNYKNQTWEYSNPIAMVDGFNNLTSNKLARKDVMVIKAIKDSLGKGNSIKSIHIQNAVSRAYSKNPIADLNQIVEEIKNEVSTLKIRGYSNSYFDSSDKLFAPKEFNPDEADSFVIDVCEYLRNDDKTLNLTSNKLKITTKSLVKSTAAFAKVHGTNGGWWKG